MNARVNPKAVFLRGKGLLIGMILLIFILAVPAAAKRILPPEEYGRVILNNFSGNSGFAPVVFDHWLHRANFTCRLCHVDIGFAMVGGATKINAASNSKGLYCGACHDGKRVYGDRKIFPSCTDKFTQEDVKTCDRCHSSGKKVKREYAFKSFTERLPKEGLGNGIDWEEAEAKGLIKPVDFLEGVSVKRPPLQAQKDFTIESRGNWMSDITFSHKKHAIWNGCEVCHPEIFPSVKKGEHKYTMFQIYSGEYCGLCHINVAFPLNECHKCHTKPVQPLRR